MIERKHINDLAILVVITVAIGVYLIAATITISEDGVTYIERAQILSTHSHKILNLNEPAGMPALIAAFHYVFSSDDSPLSWILSAQVCVLTCRTLTIVILYLFGTALFSRQQSFWAVGALIFLPYPAHFGADVLREWPHLLFLFTGLWLLYNGIQKTSAVYLFGAGLICGLGTIIRPECAQVMLYGLVFFLYQIVSAVRKRLPLRRHWIYLCLAAGFLAVFLPYAAHLEKIAPHKLQDLYRQFQQTDTSTSSGTPASSHSPQYNDPFCHSREGGNPATKNDNAGSHDHNMSIDGVLHAGFEAKSLFHAIGNLLNGIAENLMYYFALPAGIGFHLLFLKSPRQPGDRRLLVGLFFGFYIAVLCLLYWRWGYISRRHTLPLTVMVCYCIPVGIEQMAQWLERKRPSDKEALRKWGVILTTIGILICLPKLCRPVGYDKKSYRQAADWIAENTNPNDRFYTFDNRIPFYADRPYRLYKNAKRFRARFKADYLITQSKNGQIEVPVPQNLQLQKTFPLHSTDREVLIFKRIP